MTLIDGTSGFLPRFMWCGRADIPECPAPRSKTSGAPSYSFGAVLKAADMTSVRPGSARCGIAQPRLTLSGQRRYTDERFGLLSIAVGATSRTGSRRLKPCEELQSSCADYNLGNPCAEKVRPHRARQSFGSSGRTLAPLESASLLNWGRSQDQRGALLPKTMASEPDACAGVGSPRQGMLTITGSNVRLGTEMPVALSSFSL
jgi:hypothetical protein